MPNHSPGIAHEARTIAQMLCGGWCPKRALLWSDLAWELRRDRIGWEWSDIMSSGDGWFFTFCIAFVFAVLWWFHDRLKRVEEKLDRLIGK
jgi:hypothetical protein